MIALALGDVGHVVRVSDGQGPVERADADILLIDVRLGNRTVADVIAEHPELVGLPTVLMTAGSEVLPKGSFGAAAVLRKPFDLDVLERTLLEIAGST